MPDKSDNADPHFLAEASVEAGSSELVHNLLRLAQIAVYRRKTILQAVCGSVLLGAAYFVLATRYYDSTARLLIIERNQDQLASVSNQPNLDNTMATHRELVLSPIVIQQAIEYLLPEHRVDFQTQPPSEWNNTLGQRLRASTTRKTNFIEVSYRSVSPEAAAAVVSAVIQAYLEFVERTHQGSASEVIDVLTRERDQLTRDLSAKQNQLQECRQQVGHLAIHSEDGTADPTIRQALKLNEALLETQQRRIKLQASLATALHDGDSLQQQLIGLEDVVGPGVLVSALGFSPQDIDFVKEQEQKLLDARTALQNAEPFYGPAHPKIIEFKQRIHNYEQSLASSGSKGSQRLAAYGGPQLGATLRKLLEQSVAQAAQQEKQLQASFEEARAEAARQSGDLVQLEMLEREVARLESLHDVLFEKIAAVDIRQLHAPIQATVVQEPLPQETPDSPQLRLVVIAALLGGLMVGGLIAYVEDVLDDRFASPEDISAQLRVPVLAMVRRFEAIDGEGINSIHTFVSPNAAETETFRTLRTALTLGSGATERIAISSAEPGDGKTTVVANLAVSFAQAGKTTLLIDADLRKPGLTALMGLKGQPGVSDALSASDAPARMAAGWIHHTDQPGLDVLPAGLRRPNPAELLGGSAFVELLAWAESCYDQVLVDCPPVLAVSDAQIIGRLVDGAILVVQPNKNHRRLVARACDSFVATGTTVLGVVANGLLPDAGRGYGFGSGYGCEYRYGDGQEEEFVETNESSSDDVVPDMFFGKTGVRDPALANTRQRPDGEQSASPEVILRFPRKSDQAA